jgi:hypothetical protein
MDTPSSAVSEAPGPALPSRGFYRLAGAGDKDSVSANSFEMTAPTNMEFDSELSQKANYGSTELRYDCPQALFGPPLISIAILNVIDYSPLGVF